MGAPELQIKRFILTLSLECNLVEIDRRKEKFKSFRVGRSSGYLSNLVAKFIRAC